MADVGIWDWLHLLGGWAVMMSNGLVGCWALAALRWSRLDGAALVCSLGVAWVLVFVQIALGAAVVAARDVVAPSFHVLYGVCTALSVAFAVAYRDQIEHRRLELFGGASLFIMGLSIRAMFIGS